MAEITPVTEKRYLLSEKVDATPEVLIVRFKPEDGGRNVFEPGMFMMIFGVDGAGKRFTGRAFSIASDPASPEMEFFVIKQPVHANQVTTSHFVAANMGDPFIFKGPSGQFKFNPAAEKKVVFLAGGTGLAPFMSMLRHIKLTNAGTDVILLYSVKYPTEVILKDELVRLATDLRARLIVTVTRPWQAPSQSLQQPGMCNETGHIDANMIGRHCNDLGERTFYICGPLKFVQALKQTLASLNIPNERVKADVWG